MFDCPILKNLSSTLALFLQASPDKETQAKIIEALLSKSEVREAHHMHYWSLDGESHVLIAHLVLNAQYDVPELQSLKQVISEDLSAFDLSHTTIEFEFPNEVCRDD